MRDVDELEHIGWFVYHCVVNFVFADSSETKSVIESSSSETSDLKYGEDPGPEPDWFIIKMIFCIRLDSWWKKMKLLLWQKSHFFSEHLNVDVAWKKYLCALYSSRQCLKLCIVSTSVITSSGWFALLYFYFEVALVKSIS